MIDEPHIPDDQLDDWALLSVVRNAPFNGRVLSHRSHRSYQGFIRLTAAGKMRMEELEGEVWFAVLD